MAHTLESDSPQVLPFHPPVRRERDAARDPLAAARSEADRLTREARELHREAARTRERTRTLAARYARQARHKLASIRRQLETQQSQLDESRGQLSAELKRLEIVRIEFQTERADEAARQREAWAELEAQRERQKAARAEAEAFAAQREAALTARAAELAHREKTVSGTKSKLESATAALRQEAAGLETRAAHAREIVEELEQKREELRAEILATIATPEPEAANDYRVPLDRKADRDLTRWTAELDEQEHRLTEEKAALTKLKASLDRESVSLADQRKVLAEQFALLGAARAECQEQESHTLAEMEEFARELRQRDEDLTSREERLAQMEAARCEELVEAERTQQRLEEWQTKLTNVSQLWHIERERREQSLSDRLQTLTEREAALHASLSKWEQIREGERERLRADLQLWADDRARMAAAVAECDRRSREMVGDLAMHAARAMAAEDLLAETAGVDSGTTRRFNVLLKRWEGTFARKLLDFESHRNAVAIELVRVRERHEELHRALQELTERTHDDQDRSTREQILQLATLPIESEEDLPLAAEVVEEVNTVQYVLPFAMHRQAA